MNLYAKYIEKLNSIPPPGGNGCHPALLGTANLGLLAGLSAEQIHADIRASIPAGKRKISDREIQDALNRAMQDNGCGQRYVPPKPEPIVHDGARTLQKIISRSTISEEVDLWAASPIRIDWEPKDDPVKFLSIMYEPADLIFIGERDEPGIVGRNIRTRSAWIEYFTTGGRTAPFIIINPFTGKPALKKSGTGETLRGDANIAAYRYCLVEFDNLTREEQIRFWTSPVTQKLDIAVITDTAGKSLHGWIRTPNIKTSDDWRREIRGKLYEQSLIPLGVDAACSNPARLSRFPGHLRDGKYQRILWMNMEAQK